MRKLFLASLLVLMTACASPHPQAVKHVGEHDVALYVTPGVSGEANDVRVEVRGPRIPAVSELTLSMPDMPMPAQRVALRDSGTDSYDAAGVTFSMSGTWHVAVIERRGNGAAELASFDVSVR